MHELSLTIVIIFIWCLFIRTSLSSKIWYDAFEGITIELNSLGF